MSRFRTLLRLSRPLHLLLIALTYTLGAGMARYLSGLVNITTFWLGMIYVLVLQFSAYLLSEFFRMPTEPLAEGETPRQREHTRTFLVQVAAASLTLATALTFLLLYLQLLTFPAGIFLMLIFVLLMAYAVPPTRLVNSGFGELALAVFWADFIPALAFLLQANEFHRLLPLITFPLTLLALAYLLVCNFPTFATDQKYARHTLLIQLTWPRAIPLHHLLILATYLLFAAAPFFGLARGLVWPVFLTLPFAGFQIYWLQRISQGGRPLWNLLTTLAVSFFGLTVYLLALTFWIR